jgi:hypothetical protein
MLILLALAALILGDLNERMVRARNLEQDRETLELAIAELEAENAQLKTEQDQADWEETIIRWAHADAKLVREGEHLVIPLSEGAARSQQPPEQASVSQPLENIEIWLQVIFGD